MRNNDIDSLFSFIDSSPTPYHVIDNMVQALKKLDGNLVTSRIPSGLPAFCREIVKLLEAEPVSG